MRSAASTVSSDSVSADQPLHHRASLIVLQVFRDRRQPPAAAAGDDSDIGKRDKSKAGLKSWQKRSLPVGDVTFGRGNDVTPAAEESESIQTYGSASRSTGDCRVMQLTEAVSLLTDSASLRQQQQQQQQQTGSVGGLTSDPAGDLASSLTELRGRFANRTIVLCKPVNRSQHSLVEKHIVPLENSENTKAITGLGSVNVLDNGKAFPAGYSSVTPGPAASVESQLSSWNELEKSGMEQMEMERMFGRETGTRSSTRLQEHQQQQQQQQQQHRQRQHRHKVRHRRHRHTPGTDPSTVSPLLGEVDSTHDKVEEEPIDVVPTYAASHQSVRPRPSSGAVTVTMDRSTMSTVVPEVEATKTSVNATRSSKCPPSVTDQPLEHFRRLQTIMRSFNCWDNSASRLLSRLNDVERRTSVTPATADDLLKSSDDEQQKKKKKNKRKKTANNNKSSQFETFYALKGVRLRCRLQRKFDACRRQFIDRKQKNEHGLNISWPQQILDSS